MFKYHVIVASARRLFVPFSNIVQSSRKRKWGLYVHGTDFSDVALDLGQVNKTGVDESFDLSGRLST